ncbi:MAG: CBS domain-containing protein [wastewater metagenome]|nr:CBS domain-containing protein [Candidatus Loosdrechtia aerotolerans]
MKVKDIMDTSPDFILGTDTFKHLVNILDQVKYHVVFVVDQNGTLIGILTEGDMIKVLIPKYVTVDESLLGVMGENYFEKKSRECKDLTVNEIMTKNVITVQGDDTIIKAAALMFINKIHSLPVVKNSKVIGILPRQILLKYITKVLTE